MKFSPIIISIHLSFAELFSCFRQRNITPPPGEVY